MSRIVCALMVGLVVSASLAGPALAPCTTITVTGSNWQAGSTVEITLDGAVLTNALADADENVSVRETHHRCAAWQRD